jgi:hypothetical protein
VLLQRIRPILEKRIDLLLRLCLLLLYATKERGGGILCCKAVVHLLLRRAAHFVFGLKLIAKLSLTI